MPEALADRARLAQQDVEHDEVDLVVGAVEQDGADLGPLLAVAVDPALALLQPVRVPGQVVVEHGVEMVLEVDPLRQAVGGDQDPLLRAGQLLDLLPALLVAQGTRDRAHVGAGQQLAELVGEVVGGVDEAAEDDRPVAVGEQLGDDGPWPSPAWRPRADP